LGLHHLFPKDYPKIFKGKFQKIKKIYNFPLFNRQKME